MVPVRQLADELGVCVKTVRTAQQFLAREGLLEIRHGSGVYVNEPPAQPAIGIFSNLDILQPRTSAFHLQVPRDLRTWFRQQGMAADIYIGEAESGDTRLADRHCRFMKDVAAGQLDAVALLNIPETTDWADWIQALSIPAVGAMTPYTAEADFAAMARAGVQRLHAQGCTRIALLAWDIQRLTAPFRAALKAVGLDYHPEWLRGNLHPMLSGAGWEEFREIWFAARDKPDGLLIGDDVLFAEASLAIQELGIQVPGHLRIVSHANAGVLNRYPFDVTLFEVDPMHYAAALGEHLLALLRGCPVPRPATPVCFTVRAVSGGSQHGRRPADKLQRKAHGPDRGRHSRNMTVCKDMETQEETR